MFTTEIKPSTIRFKCHSVIHSATESRKPLAYAMGWSPVQKYWLFESSHCCLGLYLKSASDLIEISRRSAQDVCTPKRAWSFIILGNNADIQITNIYKDYLSLFSKVWLFACRMPLKQTSKYVFEKYLFQPSCGIPLVWNYLAYLGQNNI